MYIQRTRATLFITHEDGQGIGLILNSIFYQNSKPPVARTHIFSILWGKAVPNVYPTRFSQQASKRIHAHPSSMSIHTLLSVHPIHLNQPPHNPDHLPPHPLPLPQTPLPINPLPRPTLPIPDPQHPLPTNPPPQNPLQHPP